MFGRVLLVALAAAQAQDPPVVELDSAGDQTSAPDGVDGFRVHRVRPPLDGRRGRGDPRRGPMSDHNFDEDHWLAPTNPRTAFALHHAAALGGVDEVMRLLRGCTEAHMRNCNETACLACNPTPGCAVESEAMKADRHLPRRGRGGVPDVPKDPPFSSRPTKVMFKPSFVV